MIPQFPSYLKIAMYIFGSFAGIALTYYLNKFLKQWGNEIKDPQNAQKASDGRTQADQSDQNLNSQTEKLPKD